MVSRKTRVLIKPGGSGVEIRKDISAEYNPLFFQMDHVTIEPEERRSTQLLVAGLVVVNRLSKTEAKQILLALGLT